MPVGLFFFFWIALATVGLLWVHMNFGIMFLFLENVIGILMVNSFTLQMSLSYFNSINSSDP